MADSAHAVLGLSETASRDEIEAAYKALVRKYHPDQYEGHPLRELAETRLREINAAYAQLSAQAAPSASPWPLRGSALASWARVGLAAAAVVLAFRFLGPVPGRLLVLGLLLRLAWKRLRGR